MTSLMNKPQPGLLTIWRVYLALISFVLAFITSVLLRVASAVWITAVCLWTSLFLGLFLIYLPMLYKSVSFGISGDKILLVSGVFVSRTVAVPLFQIQFTTITQTIFDRIFGLSSLIITAAGGRMVISGLKTSDAADLAALLRE